jgi:hypothetical protein
LQRFIFGAIIATIGLYLGNVRIVLTLVCDLNLNNQLGCIISLKIKIMKTLTGYLTQTNKSHIKAILEANLLKAGINGIFYSLSFSDGVFTVLITKKDGGLIDCGGSELRFRTTLHTFKL